MHRRSALILPLLALGCGDDMQLGRGLGIGALFDGAPPSGGPAPALLTPESGDTFDDGGEAVVLHASIPGGAPAATKVDFYQGTTLLGTANAAPWQYLWSPTVGSYTVTAAATYADGTVGTSAGVPITVGAQNSFNPTTIPQLALWCDPADNATITLAGSRPQTITRFRDGAVFSSDMTQATAGNQCEFGRFRGRQCIVAGTVSTTTSRYTATLVATVGLPYTLDATFRPTGLQADGVVCSSNGTDRIAVLGTSWPRTLREVTSAALNSSLPVSKPCAVRFLVNSTSSEVSLNGTLIQGPGANGGNSGLVTEVSWPGKNTGGAEPGQYGDLLVFKGAVSAGNVASYEAWRDQKWHVNDPIFTILYVGASGLRGFGTTGGGARRYLHDELLTRGKIAGHWIDEIGIFGTVPRFFAADSHYCVDNKGINNMRTNLIPLLGSGGQLSPDIIVSELGINNAASSAGETYVAGTGAGTTRGEHMGYVNDIYTKLPNVQLIELDISPSPVAGTQTNVLTLNATWHSDTASVAAGLGKTFEPVLWNAALGGPSYNFGTGNFQADGHPSEAIGHHILADLLKTAIINCAARM